MTTTIIHLRSTRETNRTRCGQVITQDGYGNLHPACSDDDRDVTCGRCQIGIESDRRAVLANARRGL